MTWDTQKSLLWSLRSSEVIWGHGEVKWPPIGLKHWKVGHWSHYLSFDMSHDTGYTKVIVVVMEVIWGHISGHGEVKWPPIGLKHWKAEYWSHYISFNMSLDMGYASHCCGHGGHLRSHFWSCWGQMTSNWSKTLKGRKLKSLPIIWYVTWHGIRKSHCCGHGSHLRSHFQSWWGQMTSNWSKTLKGRILKSTFLETVGKTNISLVSLVQAVIINVSEYKS